MAHSGVNSIDVRQKLSSPKWKSPAWTQDQGKKHKRVWRRPVWQDYEKKDVGDDAKQPKGKDQLSQKSMGYSQKDLLTLDFGKSVGMERRGLGNEPVKVTSYSGSPKKAHGGSKMTTQNEIKTMKKKRPDQEGESDWREKMKETGTSLTFREAGSDPYVMRILREALAQDIEERKWAESWPFEQAVDSQPTRDDPPHAVRKNDLQQHGNHTDDDEKKMREVHRIEDELHQLHAKLDGFLGQLTALGFGEDVGFLSKQVESEIRKDSFCNLGQEHMSARPENAKAKKARLLSGAKPSNNNKKKNRDDDSDSDSDGGGVRLDDENKSKKASFDRTNLSSREAHAKQRQLAQERKAAKPLADQVHRTKKIWERLRKRSDVPKDERQRLVKELFDIVTGRCRDFVLKHDAVRAVQTAIKYSTPEQRLQIATELDGSYADLAESRYAKFLIGKLLAHNNDEIRDMVIPNFYGRVRKLISHAEASWILDDIYRTVATRDQKAMLLREWYGPEFALGEMNKDKELTAELKQILESEPSKRGPIMKGLLHLINSLVQKRMSGFTMLHDAMWQYFSNLQVGSEEFSDFLELVKGDESGDLLKNMAFTKSGARLACLLLAYGSSKDRKHLLKGYKDTMLVMAGDPYAHVVLLTAYDVIDDTKLVAKAVFPELIGDKDEEKAQNVVGAVNNANARTTMLYLFEGLSPALFPASHAFDVEMLREAAKIRKSTSKKDDNLRRKELVTALAPYLLAAIEAAADELTSTAFGCQFVTDVLLSEVDGKEKALEAVARCAGQRPEPDETSERRRQDISQTPFGGRMLKSLIQGGRFDKAAGKVVPVQPRLGFGQVLYPVIKDDVVGWATGPSSFVVVALLEADDFGEAEGLRSLLKENRALLEKAATEMTAEQKSSREARKKASSSDQGEGTGKKRGGEGGAVGNAGSRLLLEKL
ncbi:hypothetical protein L249_5852 [Ophiocordyceps polyrhachis-furcata BCC 54312]|uniref:PUM-HD domain-containing protein n=1 Tax=Ophiocordyceps polyrhachis-furcata BCC 54312 TaxID=1330021 RepID=A0A367L0C6_9HYPO|nr:hypothetical protein L249_5852 [Ophiocordyceps polyrhachis-furcata BCC 54312]